jgi:hypothetical protein
MNLLQKLIQGLFYTGATPVTVAQKPPPRFAVHTVPFVAPERSKADLYKLSIMEDFLTVIKQEEVDIFLLGMLETAARLNYKLQGEPEAVVRRINMELENENSYL